ncbi:MAG: hypothetical protein K6A40_01775 [Solobacterium sp.]|nr:hypothetical protein [Solobacterium sp.]
MYTVQIHRKKKMASALMPYWIIVSDKEAFMKQNGLEGDLCEQSAAGFPISRIRMDVLDQAGMRIRNGETITLELEEPSARLFASTMDGCLSSEMIITEDCILTLTTKGGWRTVSRPWFE